jgi:O-antigen ligase
MNPRCGRVKKNVGAKKLGGAFFVLALFFCFEYIRPQDAYLSAIGQLKIPMILTLLIFVILMKNSKGLLKDRLVVLMLLFLAQIALSVTFAVNTYFASNVFWGMSILMVVVLTMPFVVNTADKFITFTRFWVAINCLLAIYVLFHGGRGPGGFLYDENDVSLTINMAVPLALTLFFLGKENKTFNFMYLGASFILIAAVIASMSRGGFLGLASIPFAYWLFSHDRLKTLGKMFLIVTVLAYPAYKIVPEEYYKEIASISDTEDDTRNTRMEFWVLAWDMYKDNPVLGVGARNYAWNVVTYQMKRPDFNSNDRLLGGREAHSLYFTLLPEHGSLGVVLYLSILYQLYSRLRFVIKLSKINQTYYNYGVIAKGLLVSLITYLISGAFISVLYYPSFWYLAGFVMILDTIVKKQQLVDENDGWLLARDDVD